MTELREQGADVERLALAGDDEGDLIIKWQDRRGHGRVAVVEAKNRKQISLAQFVEEAVVERDNYCRRRKVEPSNVEAVAIVKRRNHPWHKAYVVMTVDEYMKLGESNE